MADTYANFEELRAAEPDAYMLFCRNPGRTTIIVAPHGGNIEAGTSEIAREIAGDDFAYYIFEGIKSSDNTTLHITSSNFDEPRGIALMQSANIVLAVHGEGSDEDVAYVGGANADAKALLIDRLSGAGYATDEHPVLLGTSPRNVCNIGQKCAGVQLELSRGMRASFFESLTRAGRQKPTARMIDFCGIIRMAMADMEAME